jgi:hypothetical protein
VSEKLICGFDDDTVSDRRRNHYLASQAVDMLSEKYDWLWRLAPEALLTENVTYDPFAMLASSGKRYGYLSTMQDDTRCLTGLWDATRAYVSVKDLEPTFFNVLPENMVFYNGFEIAHASLFTSPQYKDFFEFIDRQGGMFYHRWTEANVHTLALSLLTAPHELHRFSDVGFEHWPFIKQQSNRAVNKKALEHSVRGRSLTVSPAPELNSLFAARRLGFLGADVATSFRLPSVAGYGDYLWLFGDTFLGTSDGTARDRASMTLVHNSIAFTPAGHDLAPSDVAFYWPVDAHGKPTELFKPQHGESDMMLWPVTGFSVEYEGTAKVVLFAQRVKKTHGTTPLHSPPLLPTAASDVMCYPFCVCLDVMELLVAEGMNFEVQGTSIIVVDNPHSPPSRWTYRVGDLPGTDQTHNW